jgi:hypothetical protein
VVPVAVAGVGVVAYLIWRKSRESAAPGFNSAGTPNAAYLEAQRAGEAPVSAAAAAADVVAPIISAASAAKDAANAAWMTSKDAVYTGPELPSKTATLKGIGAYIDVSAAGAPYQGMFGVGGVQAVSTVSPFDLARRAPNFAPVRPVSRQFAAPARTGGTFSRDLFTGMDG